MDNEEFQAQETLKSLMSENWIDDLDSYNDIEYYDDYAYGMDSQSDFSWWHLWYCPLPPWWGGPCATVYWQSTQETMTSIINRRHVHLALGSLFYIGWDRKPSVGDEAFGVSVGDLYLGRYDGNWYFGILDENGVLN